MTIETVTARARVRPVGQFQRPGGLGQLDHRRQSGEVLIVVQHREAEAQCHRDNQAIDNSPNGDAVLGAPWWNRSTAASKSSARMDELEVDRFQQPPKGHDLVATARPDQQFGLDRLGQHGPSRRRTPRRTLHQHGYCEREPLESMPMVSAISIVAPVVHGVVVGDDRIVG